MRRPAPEDISPRYSYRIFWTKQALGWSDGQRAEILKAAEDIIEADDFEPNAYQRVYQLDQLAGQKFAGQSILTLYDVLEELERIKSTGGSE